MNSTRDLHHLSYGRIWTPIFALIGALTAFPFHPTGGKASVPVAEPRKGGAVHGNVHFLDTYPEKERIKISKDNAVCGAVQYAEEFVVSEDTRGLQNVVISIEGTGKQTRAPSGTTATITQQKCRYVPHVQAVLAGTVLEIYNRDGILHNVHAYHGEPSKTFFNKAHPKALEKLTQRLRRSGVYHFKCDVHSHMKAYLVVFDHPYFAVTDANGNFSIEGVPAGSYTVKAWHESLGTMEKSVTVVTGKSVELEFGIGEN